jgi:hypothetical protein
LEQQHNRPASLESLVESDENQEHLDATRKEALPRAGKRDSFVHFVVAQTYSTKSEPLLNPQEDRLIIKERIEMVVTIDDGN